MKPKSVKEFIEAARAAGHDAFGIANDPEALEALERVNARRWLLENFVRNLVQRYPLPWHIDRDWTVEVLTRKGACVAKCQTAVQADELISMAEKIVKEDREASAKIKALLDEVADPGETTEPRPECPTCGSHSCPSAVSGRGGCYNVPA